jgi:hypothetical protein
MLQVVEAAQTLVMADMQILVPQLTAEQGIQEQV